MGKIVNLWFIFLVACASESDPCEDLAERFCCGGEACEEEVIAHCSDADACEAAIDAEIIAFCAGSTDTGACYAVNKRNWTYCNGYALPYECLAE